jgi:hypothetical protein
VNFVPSLMTLKRSRKQLLQEVILGPHVACYVDLICVCNRHAACMRGIGVLARKPASRLPVML